MRSPFFIVGPTAVGKTGIAVAVAERCGAEIVNADAFQLYAGLDLLTAKPSPHELARAPHHLVGTVPLSENGSVASYHAHARQILDDLSRRGRPALVVGGSGLYVKSLTHGLSLLPPAQPALRAALDALDVATLLDRLAVLDPASAATIDTKNKRRLVRAVEVCETTGRPFSGFRAEWSSPGAFPVPCGVFLTRAKPDLDARIRRRVETMFARGVIEEIRAISPATLSENASRMIGWREIQSHLRGELPLPACIATIETATRQYAKRQGTWFRRETAFDALPLAADAPDTAAIDLICERFRRAHN